MPLFPSTRVQGRYATALRVWHLVQPVFAILPRVGARIALRGQGDVFLILRGHSQGRASYHPGGGVTVRREPGGRLRLLGPRAPAPLSRARKVASWQACLPSPTTTRRRCRLSRHGGPAPLFSKKRTTRQSRQRQGRGARSAPALPEACGQKPTPRWAFPHARPHESSVAVCVTTREPSEKGPCCDVIVRLPICLYFSDGFSGLFGLDFGHFSSPTYPS